MSRLIHDGPAKSDASWSSRHRVWAWIMVWIALLIVIRLVGWGIGHACDGAMSCFL
ncbi:MAG: hypothetical protein J6S08_07965 [Duodenibacillus sp.]|nr:hypothetical protein [Duodenibacillus sp.]